MHKLPLSFALLTYSGFWRPTKWPVYSRKYWLYNVYSVVMVLLLYTFTFYAMVDSVISKDLKTMTDKFSLFISVLGVCFKVANLFLKREKIIDVVNVLSKENCVPRDEQETIIQRKFDAYARKLTIYCEILNESATWFATVAQFDKFLSTRTLPVSNWVPYDVSSKEVHVMSLLHQTFGLMICANASVANETLIAGLMIQVGAQFEIFCHRARILPVSMIQAERESTSEADLKSRRKRILVELVEHHLEIYKFAHTVNTIFQYMIFLQFSISSTVLCLTIYKTSTADSFDVDIVWNFSYLCCMLMQVYLYCWFGNEVTLKVGTEFRFLESLYHSVRYPKFNLIDDWAEKILKFLIRGVYSFHLHIVYERTFLEHKSGRCYLRNGLDGAPCKCNEGFIDNHDKI